eukprot:9469002-Pyramimonas_sp.AAC.1
MPSVRARLAMALEPASSSPKGWSGIRDMSRNALASTFGGKAVCSRLALATIASALMPLSLEPSPEPPAPADVACELVGWPRLEPWAPARTGADCSGNRACCAALLVAFPRN